MTKKTRPKELRGKARLRAEIVEGARALHRLGAVTDQDLEKTTLRMLGKDAVPKIEPLAPTDIQRLRKKANVSQAVLAAFMNVATHTVSQWESGDRRPTGAALKLLHIIKREGIKALA